MGESGSIMGKILEIVNHMDPKTALTEMAAALKGLLPLLDEETRSNFVMNLIGESGSDKVSSMVHL